MPFQYTFYIAHAEWRAKTATTDIQTVTARRSFLHPHARRGIDGRKDAHIIEAVQLQE